jgi:hypothetical protein
MYRVDAAVSTPQLSLHSGGASYISLVPETAPGANSTVNVPVASCTLATTTTSQVVSNKTLTSVTATSSTNTLASKQLLYDGAGGSSGAVDLYTSTAAPQIGQVLRATASTLASWGWPAFRGVAIYQQQASSGTAGGTLTTGQANVRALTWIATYGDISPDNSVSQQIGLSTGTYLFVGEASAYRVDQHRTTIRNVTQSVEYTSGSMIGYSPSNILVADASSNTSTCRVAVTVSTGKDFFQMITRVGTTRNTSGGGLAGDFGGNEVYATLLIYQLGT